MTLLEDECKFAINLAHHAKAEYGLAQLINNGPLHGLATKCKMDVKEMIMCIRITNLVKLLIELNDIDPMNPLHLEIKHFINA